MDRIHVVVTPETNITRLLVRNDIVGYLKRYRASLATIEMHTCMYIGLLLLFIVGTESRGRLPLSEVAYQTIVKRLRGEYNTPVAERTREERNALHKLWRNPSRFSIENNQLLFDGKIAARQQDIDRCVYKIFKQTNGAGARKIRNRLAVSCSGISEARIYRSLQKARSRTEVVQDNVSNETELKEILVREIQEVHQIDLVDLHPEEAVCNGNTFRYILIVIDLFSRFIWTRPLTNKKPSRIAKVLAKLYYEHGPPKVVQRARGKVLESAIAILGKKQNFNIIMNRPYFPKPRGKTVEPHSTLQRKFFFDLFKARKKLKTMVNQSGPNWVENLQGNTHIINNEPNGYLKSPFQTYFGRSYNANDNKSLDFGTPDNVRNDNCIFIPKQSPLKTRQKTTYNIPNAQRTADPPCVYNVGDNVYVRIRFPSQALNQRNYVSEGQVLECNWKSGIYRLQYEQNGIVMDDWFHFTDITSRTTAGEKAIENIAENEKTALDLYHYNTSCLKNILATFRLRVRMNPSGDGNCQFHALVDQLALLGIHMTTQGLRTKLTSDIQRNPYLVDGSPIEPFVGSVQAYTGMMSLPGTYGDHVTLQRTAQLFNVQIIVVSSLGATATRLISLSGSYDELLPTLFLGHLAEGRGEHYLSLTPYNESHQCVFEYFQGYIPFNKPVKTESRHRTVVEDSSGQYLGSGQTGHNSVDNDSENLQRLNHSELYVNGSMVVGEEGSNNDGNYVSGSKDDFDYVLIKTEPTHPAF